MTVDYAISLMKPYRDRIHFKDDCLITDLLANRPRINYRPAANEWTTAQFSRFIAVAHGLISEQDFDDPEIYVCHTCHNPKCINVKHLYVGSRSSNACDSVKAGTHNMARKEYCINGHKFEPSNTRRRLMSGRAGKECDRVRMQEFRARQTNS